MSDSPAQKSLKHSLDDIVLRMPGVRDSQAFGYPAYKVNSKVCMYVGETAVWLKLPESRVTELVNKADSQSALKVSNWKTWLKIEPDDLSAVDQFEDLLWESVQFVADDSTHKNTKRKAKSEPTAPPPHKAALDAILLEMPGVVGVNSFGYPSYKLGGKMFAYVDNTGASLKLTDSRVKDILAQSDCPPSLQAGQWKAWLAILADDVAQFEQFRDLFWEAVELAAEAKK